jgi:hypothetical protein
MKYLIVKIDGIEQAILFAPTMTHQTVAKCINADAIISGGFARIRGDKADYGDGKSLDVFCYGESLSVGVRARPDKDEAIIQRDANWPD